MKLFKEIRSYLISEESPLSLIGKVVLFVPGIFVITIFWIGDRLLKEEEREPE